MKKLLFIRYKKTANVFEGGEQGSQKNWNVLIHLLGEENVYTYYIHDENHKRSVIEYLKGAFWFPFGYFFGLTPRRAKDILTLAKDYDYVFVDRSIFGIIAKKLKTSGYNGRVICFFHNVEYLYFEAKLAKKPWRFAVVHCADKNDRWCCQYADRIIALNDRDQSVINTRYGRKADALIPVAFRDKYQRVNYTQEMTRQKPVCLFLGAYFEPNCEGIEWFAENVYPHVDIKMTIVGKGMGKIRDKYRIPEDVDVISDVPDLLPYFEDADIMILPIFKGSGMKVKTCESLMYGKNIIATDEAFEGYVLDYDKAGGKCNTAQEFISAIQSFIDNPRPKFNKYCRNIFLGKYSEESVVESFRKILEF